MSRISCPYCHASLQTAVEVAGKSVKCGQCGKVFAVADVVPSDDTDQEDNELIAAPVLFLMLVAGHLVGLLLLAIVIGPTRSVVVLSLIVGVEVAVWQRRRIASWLQRAWESVKAQRLFERSPGPVIEEEGLVISEDNSYVVNDSHPEYAVQRNAVDWARRVLRRRRKYVILDTETTGLGTRDEIIQLAVIDLEGNVLFNEYIRPTKVKRIDSGASRVHGISMSMLSGCPTFSQFAKPLKKAIGKRNIITYNAQFDLKMYTQSLKAASDGFLPHGQWECAMLNYAEFVGEWNDYYGNYRWHKLQGGDHSALGDCLATLRLIRAMASATKLKKWYQFWIGR